MENRKAIFLFGSNSSTKLKEVKQLKKLYKLNSINTTQIIDSEGAISILTFEEMLRENDIDFVNVDLITDRLDLILTVFRIYQKHIQNFIYIDNPNYQYVTQDEPILIQQLLENFDGIEDEEIQSKIYTNLNDTNYLSLIGKLINQLDYVSLLTNFEVSEATNDKVIRNKCYWLNQEDNIFIDFEIEETEQISLTTERMEIIKRFSKVSTVSDAKIAAYYILYQLNSIGVKDFVGTVNELSSIFKDEQFIQFEGTLIELLDKADLNVNVKTVLFQVLFEYREQFHETLYKKIKNFMYTNQLDWEYWKSLVVMFYGFNFSKTLKLSDDVYKTTKEVNIAVSEIIEKQLEVKYEFKKEENNKKVVILIDQLLSLFHSPTNVLKVQLEHLLKDTNYEYHIIIEENMIQPKDEYVLGFQKFLGNESAHTVNKFRELFDDNRVKLYLVNKDSDITSRVNIILDTVFKINPKLIFSLSYYSTAQNLLYKYYPVINFSFGHEYLPAKAHLYLYKNEIRARDLAKKFNDKVVIKKYIQPPTTIPRTKNYTRKDFGYEAHDFIIITSGNRIDKEISEELIDKMKVALEKNKNFKWLLVGATIPKYMQDSYTEQMLYEQIQHISYEKDLIALNEICDISINPNRVGGGYSVATCISVGVPVLMCNYESDGLIFVGKENTCGETYDDLIKHLLICYENKEFKMDLLSRQQKQLENTGTKDETYLLIKFFDETVNRVNHETKLKK